MKDLVNCFKRGFVTTLGLTAWSVVVFTLLCFYPIPTLIAMGVIAFLVITVAVGACKLEGKKN